MNTLSQLTDDQLVRLYTEGNNAAFDVLLKRHEERLFGYLLQAVRSQELAEDLFQDIFMKVLVRLQNGQYADKGRFPFWLMRIAHNHLVDYFRTSHAGLSVSNDATPTDLLLPASMADYAAAETEAVNRQLLRDVQSLIALLPETQRQVLLMRMDDELSFKEIAAKTNCSINTALGRMRYAIQNLRQMAAERDIHCA